MTTERTRLLGKLTLGRVDPDMCWTTPQEFLRKLINLVRVEFGFSEDHDVVVYGHSTPGEDDKGKLWVRRALNGAFLGFFGFEKGQWRKLRDYEPNEVIWLSGDSRTIPEGYELIGPGTGGFTTDTIKHLMASYKKNIAVENETVYSVFAVRWRGY